MTAGTGDNAAAAGRADGHLRASHADRERVVELLKVAFVQGRLTQQELDTRVGLALASQAARRSGICMLAAFALMGVVALTHSGPVVSLALLSAFVAIMAASGFLAYGVVNAWRQRRSRAQLRGLPRSAIIRSGFLPM
ncbi:MAG: DUF1707 SHOCT-like domain-containing protein [Streptosporangiaceae bacterium]